jgi:type I restriction enzyme S subunit
VPRCDLSERDSAKFALRDGDIVVARTGATVGYAKYVAAPPVPAVFASYLVRFRVRNDVDARFVGHIVQSDGYKKFVVANAGGAAQPNANAKTLGAFLVPLPQLATQRRIAAALGTFDELIEINERRIELLEDLARSLYREWFVRFRFPRHEATDFVDSDIGRTPKTWTVRRLSEITSQLSRGIAPRYADDGAWIVLNQRCIRNARVSLASARRQERAVTDAKRIRFGDVLINSTGVGTLGRVAMFLLASDRLTADSHVTIVRPRSVDLQAWLGLGLIARQSEFEAMGTGSTGQTELSRQAIGDLRFAVPDPQALAAFSHVAWPILNAVPELAQYNDCLAATRDLLLPRLVTGRLDISDVDLGDLLPSEDA